MSYLTNDKPRGLVPHETPSHSNILRCPAWATFRVALLGAIADYLKVGVASLLLFSALFLLPIVLDAQIHNENSRDSVLRGTGRVNETTLGMEISINLGSYPGRGIEVPVTIQYSSKVWRIDYVNSQSAVNNPNSCIKLNSPKFSEHSASGWTSSLDIPYIEYVGMDNLYNERGFPLADGCGTEVPESDPEWDRAYVKRISFHIPGGGTYELRAGDGVTMIPFGDNQTTPDFDDVFYSTDGSNLKYTEDSRNGIYKMQMPDGSVYLFASSLLRSNADRLSIRKAISQSDRHGNKLLFDNSANSLTDTIGRNLAAPFDLKPPSTPTGPDSPKVYSLPAANGSTLDYKFHWKHLNGGSQDESALTDIDDPQYRLRHIADRASANPSVPPRTDSLFVSDFESWVHDAGAPLFNPVVLKTIETPIGNYEFGYDSYGRIEKITYPSGGVEVFKYRAYPAMEADNDNPTYDQANFGVVDRKLYPSGESARSYHWTFNAERVLPDGYRVSTTSPGGIKSERYQYLQRGTSSATRGDFGFTDPFGGMPYEDRVYDSSGKLVTAKRTFWDKTEYPVSGIPFTGLKAAWNPRKSREEYLVFDPVSGAGLSNSVVFVYRPMDTFSDPLLMNEVHRYDYQQTVSGSSFGPFGSELSGDLRSRTPAEVGDLIKTEKRTYLIFDAGIDASIRQEYLDKRILGLKSISETVDENGAVVSKAISKYDQPERTAYGLRGDLTEVLRWDSTKGSVSDPGAYVSYKKSEYDQFGNEIAAIDALGNTKTKRFDSVHNAFLISIVRPAPDPSGRNGSAQPFEQKMQYDYDSGLLVSTTSPNGLETRYEYESGTNRLVETAQFAAGTRVGGRIRKTFDDEPLNYSIESATEFEPGKWTRSIARYDGLGRLTKTEEVREGGNRVVENEFDEAGRVSRVSNPHREGERAVWTTNHYDAAGRLIRIVHADGSESTSAFGVLVSDKKGTVKTAIDPSGVALSGISNAAGDVIRVVEDPFGEPASTDYLYDSEGRLRRSAQGGQSRFFNHDSLGRLTHVWQVEQKANRAITAVDPISGNSEWSEKIEYDDNGNIIAVTDANNAVVNAEYDAINRLVKRTYSDTTSPTEFFYDGAGLSEPPANALGEITKVSNSVAEMRSTAFDSRGKVLEYEQQVGGQVFRSFYEYDLSGRLSAETYPTGRRIAYSLDSEGELTSVTSTKRGSSTPMDYLSEISRDSAGNITSRKLGNGVFESFEYNDRMQISEINAGASRDSKNLLAIAIGYGDANNGSIRETTLSLDGMESPLKQTYGYDRVGRLETIKETKNGAQIWSEAYQYDRFGNRSFDPSNTSTISSFDSNTNPRISTETNRILEDQNADGRREYGYDPAGNLIADSEGRRFAYDAEHRLSGFFSASNRGSVPDAAYQYDGLGKRVRKTNHSENVIFVYSAYGKLIAEYGEKAPNSPSLRYLTKDQLGSVRLATASNGAVAARNDYLPFGENLVSKIGNVGGRTTENGYRDTARDRVGFTGYVRDDESGLDFANARYYGSNTGRFTSVDPKAASASVANPQSLNRYSYVLNNPLVYVDPDGREPMVFRASPGAVQKFDPVASMIASIQSVMFGYSKNERATYQPSRPVTQAPVAAGPNSTDEEAATGGSEDGDTDPIAPPTHVMAEATESLISVIYVPPDGGEPIEGLIQMTSTLYRMFADLMTAAWTYGSETGAMARASSRDAVATSFSISGSETVGGSASVGDKGISATVSGSVTSGTSLSFELFGRAVVAKDIESRTKLATMVLRAAGELQNKMVKVSTINGTVSARMPYGFIVQAFQKAAKLMYERGVKLGYTAGSSADMKVDVQRKEE
ncbi:MAG: RHS repeat-associated core domain-containing protein [Pyrinomonadaceae bacterium]